MRIVIGKPNLRVDEILPLLDARIPYEYVERDDTMFVEAVKSVQLVNAVTSFRYEWMMRDDVMLETISIAHKEKAGCVVQYENGRVTHFVRIGGRSKMAAELPSYVHAKLTALLFAIHNRVQQEESA